MLRDSGVLYLPSQRTLRDYTYHTKSAPGFSKSVDVEIMDAVGISTCPEREKHVVLILDEMHIRENIVYDKHTGTDIKTWCINHNYGAPVGSITGFSNLGEVNTELAAYERSLGEEMMTHEPLANSMLVIMVRGLFSKVQFPYAQFPCTKLRGYELFDVFWEAVERLERCGFSVIACTCDGLSVNRRFFKLHSSGKCVHKVVNPYSPDKRSLFFISDPPHLIKTVRNSWNSSKRLMWVSAEIYAVMKSLKMLCC